MVPMSEVWCERRNGASAQFQVQAEIADDLVRKQTDQIRVARQTRIVIGKDLLRRRRAADVIIFFQQQHAKPRSAEIARGNKSVVARAQDYNVISAPNRAHALDRLSLADPHGIGFAQNIEPPKSLS